MALVLVQRRSIHLVVKPFRGPDIAIKRQWADLTLLRFVSLSHGKLLRYLIEPTWVHVASLRVLVLHNLPRAGSPLSRLNGTVLHTSSTEEC